MLLRNFGVYLQRMESLRDSPELKMSQHGRLSIYKEDIYEKFIFLVCDELRKTAIL